MSDRPRVYRTHAVVLRRRAYRDADRILTVFTPNYGKLEIIAKGVRKTTSRKAGHLELFGHSSLLIAQARTWDIITEAVGVASYSNLRSDLEKISQASYICELIDCFTQSEDENQPLWDLLLFTLEAIDAAQPNFPAQLLQHWFELHLLSLTGFQPQFFGCLACDEPLTPVTNYALLHEGGVLCPDCAGNQQNLEALDPDVLKVLRFLQSRSWSEVAPVAIRPQILDRAGNLIYRYLLIILERHLRSVDFMRRLQSMRPLSPAAAQPNPPTVDAPAGDAPVTDQNTAATSQTTSEGRPHAHS